MALSRLSDVLITLEVSFDDPVGSIVAFEVGIFALTLMIKIIKIGKILNFSYYCCGVGLMMIILI